MDIFRPIQIFADTITHNPTLNFFIYDVIKIFFLLLIVGFLMAIIRYYLPIEKIRYFLTQKKLYGLDYFLASMFGVITPFCSCSSIALFVGFLSSGIPLGVTLSFLITSPLVNQAAIGIFIGIFGFKVTMYYIFAGILVGVLGGFILGKMKLEKYIDKAILEIIENSKNTPSFKKENLPLKAMITLFWKESWGITKKIFPYVLIGVGLGAIIHGYVPADFFSKYLNTQWYSVPLATIFAVPLYTNAIAIIPIMEVLVSKGIPLGTALAFMMAAIGLSLPEALILRRAMNNKLIIYFFSVVTVGIILIGYLFNYIL